MSAEREEKEIEKRLPRQKYIVFAFFFGNVSFGNLDPNARDACTEFLAVFDAADRQYSLSLHTKGLEKQEAAARLLCRKT